MRIFNTYRKENILINLLLIILFTLLILLLGYVYYKKSNDIIGVIILLPTILCCVNFKPLLFIFTYILNLKKIRKSAEQEIEANSFKFTQNNLCIIDKFKNEYICEYKDITNVFFDIETKEIIGHLTFGGPLISYTGINFIKIKIHTKSHVFYLFLCKSTLHSYLKILFDIIDYCKEFSKITYFPTSGEVHPEVHRYLNLYTKNYDKKILTTRLINIYRDILIFIFIILGPVIILYLFFLF